LATKGFWGQHRADFEALCKGSKQYHSAFISRRDAWPIPAEDEYWRTLRRAWEGRPVLLIVGSKKGSRTAALLDNARSLSWEFSRKQNAWRDHERLLSCARQWAGLWRKWGAGEAVVILALGATATVLAHDLCLAGVQALDLGHAAQAFARVSPKELEEA
jgi:hypothetical protein